MDKCEYCGRETEHILKTGVSAHVACLYCIGEYNILASNPELRNRSYSAILDALKEKVKPDPDWDSETYGYAKR